MNQDNSTPIPNLPDSRQETPSRRGQVVAAAEAFFARQRRRPLKRRSGRRLDAELRAELAAATDPEEEAR